MSGLAFKRNLQETLQRRRVFISGQMRNIDRMPEMRRVVGEVPIQVGCNLREFQTRLAERRLLPNVWHTVGGEEALDPDDANRLAEKVRACRA
jgi:hypothetical protein